MRISRPSTMHQKDYLNPKQIIERIRPTSHINRAMNFDEYFTEDGDGGHY